MGVTFARILSLVYFASTTFTEQLKVFDWWQQIKANQWSLAASVTQRVMIKLQVGEQRFPEDKLSLSSLKPADKRLRHKDGGVWKTGINMSAPLTPGLNLL